MTGDALPAVSETAVGVASIRAAERGRPDPLFDDPLALAARRSSRLVDATRVG